MKIAKMPLAPAVIACVAGLRVAFTYTSSKKIALSNNCAANSPRQGGLTKRAEDDGEAIRTVLSLPSTLFTTGENQAIEMPLADSFKGRPLPSPNGVIARSDGTDRFSEQTYGMLSNYVGVTWLGRSIRPATSTSSNRPRGNWT